MAFGGFTEETFSFLTGVHFMPTETYVKSNYDTYREHVQKPFKELCAELSEDALALDDGIDTRPGRVVSRLRRDTRYSRDKTPYRDYMWLTFKRWEPEKDGFGFFFAIGPDWYDYGFGFYNPNTAAMRMLRERMLLLRGELTAMLEDENFKKIYRFEGDSFKRPILKDEPDAFTELYNCKNFVYLHEAPISRKLFDRRILGEVRAAMKTAAPVYKFIISAMYPDEG